MATTSSGDKHHISDADRTTGLVRLDQIARELTFPALSPREGRALEGEQTTLEAKLAMDRASAR
jgi:hypothetical protein